MLLLFHPQGNGHWEKTRLWNEANTDIRVNVREWHMVDSQLCRDGHNIAVNADWQVSSWDVLVLWDMLEHDECQRLAGLAKRPRNSNSSIYWVQRRASMVRWERQPASLGCAGGWVLGLPETFQWSINAVNFQFIQNVYKPVPVLVVLSSMKVFRLPGWDSSQPQSEEPFQLLRDIQQEEDYFLSSNMVKLKLKILSWAGSLRWTSLCLIAGLLACLPVVVLQESWFSL